MFKPDLYDRDEAVVAALNAPPSPLNLTVQIPEVKGGTSSPNQQVRIDKAVKYVQNEQQNAAASYTKDSL
jgi:hypothetical protein